MSHDPSLPIAPALSPDANAHRTAGDAPIPTLPRRTPLFGPSGRRTELVQAYPELDEVCMRLGFGVGLTLGEWNRSPTWAVLALAREARPPLPPPTSDLSMATIPEVITDLVTTHHVPLRHELDRLGVLVDHLAEVHSHSSPLDLHRDFHHFKDELTLHMDQEEAELFPLCIELEEALGGHQAWMPRELTALIRFSGHGHADNDSAIQRLRDQLRIAATALNDPDVGLIATGVEALARDLVVLSAKEAEILVPAAIFTEEQLRARDAKPLQESSVE